MALRHLGVEGLGEAERKKRYIHITQFYEKCFGNQDCSGLKTLEVTFYTKPCNGAGGIYLHLRSFLLM